MVFNFHSISGVRYQQCFIMMSIAIMASALLGCTSTDNHAETVKPSLEEAPMTQQCFTNYVNHPNEMEFYQETLTLTRAELTAQWQRTIPDNLMLIGGLDMYGLARFCQLSGTDPSLFEGEYVDPRLWIKGTFRYHHPEGMPMPEDLVNEYYMSDYTGQSLVLYSRPDHKKHIYLVPVDIINFPIPEQDQE